jgi:quinohemoprotein ethanol dehydrogenase
MVEAMRKLRGILVFSLVLLLAACEHPEPANPSAEQEGVDTAGWPAIGGSPLEQHFAPFSNINRKNVGELGLAWFLELDTNRGQEATPIIVGSTLYTTTAWSKVIAVDALSGNLKWQYDPQVPGPAAYRSCCDVVNRGAAYYDGKIFSATLDGRLIALDAETGALIWSVQTLDDHWPYSITGAPRVAKGKVFIGNSGADYGVRGYVSAYDAESGGLVWRFYTVPGDPAAGPDYAASDAVLASMAVPTWSGSYWQYGGGGTVWDAIVYDPELDQLYIGVGNGSPWNHRIRSDGQGDNLFLSSIVALNPDTGEYLWH